MGQRYIACSNCNGDGFRELVRVKGNRRADFISYYHHVVVCENCGLVLVNPQHDDRDYERYYKSLNYKTDKSRSKDDVLENHKYKRIPIKFLTDYLQSDQPLEGQPLVLDVGCGFGAALSYMHEYGLKAEGLEPSPVAAEFARHHFNAKVHPGSIFSHDLPHHRYDILSAMAVIEHLTDPLAGLKEMRKLLKPNGILFMNTPDLKGMVLRKGIDRYFKFVHTFYFTNVTLSSLIQSAGFEILRTWQLPPILKYSTYLYPGNFKEGQLNIIARKKDLPATPLPLKEDVDGIFRVFDAAQRRDAGYAKFNAFVKRKLLGFPLRQYRKKFVKPEFIFRDYFEGPDVVSDYQAL